MDIYSSKVLQFLDVTVFLYLAKHVSDISSFNFVATLNVHGFQMCW